MSCNHSVSDLATIIRNGYMARRKVVSCPTSKLREHILSVLKDEGYISQYIKKPHNNSQTLVDIFLKYSNSTPALNDIKVISKPSKRVYCSSKGVPLVKNGLGIVLLSTSCGIVTDSVAKTKNLGGEVLMKIF